MLHTDQLTAAAPERIIAAQTLSSQEEQLERALRPKFLADYIGQHKAKEQLAIFIAAAKKRGEALDHTLLFGPPGLGKTTLAHIIAKRAGRQPAPNQRPRARTRGRFGRAAHQPRTARRLVYRRKSTASAPSSKKSSIPHSKTTSSTS